MTPVVRLAAAVVIGVVWGVAPLDTAGALAVLLAARALPAAIEGRPAADALRGLVIGAVWFGLRLAWLPLAWDRFDGDGGARVWAGVVAVQAIAPACAFLAASAAIARGAPRVAAVPLAFAAVDGLLARLLPLPPGPSALLAGAPALAWSAAWFGIPVLSGLVAAIGALDARAAVAVLAIVLLGGVASRPIDVQTAPHEHVAIVQPDFGAFDQRRGSTADARAARLVHLLAAARGAAITPEGTWPFDPGDGPGHRRDVLRDALIDVPLAVLGVTMGDPPRNSLIVVDHGEVKGQFDKIDLVPGAERSVAGLGRDRYAAGVGSRVIDVGTSVASPLICYEDLSPAARADVDGEFIILATDDAWLGAEGSAAHLAAARLLAIETGRWVVRAATSGPSAFIDPGGVVHDPTAWVDGDVAPSDGWVIERDVPIGVPGRPGAKIALFTAALAAAALAAISRRANPPNRPSEAR